MPKNSIAVRMDKLKETKRTVVYVEVTERSGISTLYIQKEALEGTFQGYPDSITVLVTEEGKVEEA